MFLLMLEIILERCHFEACHCQLLVPFFHVYSWKFLFHEFCKQWLVIEKSWLDHEKNPPKKHRLKGGPPGWSHLQRWCSRNVATHGHFATEWHQLLSCWDKGKVFFSYRNAVVFLLLLICWGSSFRRGFLRWLWLLLLVIYWWGCGTSWCLQFAHSIVQRAQSYPNQWNSPISTKPRPRNPMFTSNPSKNSKTASHLRHLEDAVSKHVRVWIATLAEQWLRQRLAGRGAESQEASTACDTVGWLLREAFWLHCWNQLEICCKCYVSFWCKLVFHMRKQTWQFCHVGSSCLKFQEERLEIFFHASAFGWLAWNC